jgi:hypothetical protein
MAGATTRLQVSTAQREVGHARVIELGSYPAVRGVALLALGGESGGLVVQRLGVQVVAKVAAGALRIEARERSLCRAAMAGFTLDRRMRSEQRKSILMIAQLLDGGIPAADGVATLATVAELLSVNIGVAVGALRAYVAELHLQMAASAGHILMHTPQWKCAFPVVIELWRCTDRLPSDGSVAIFTGDGDRAVRISSAVGLVRLGPDKNTSAKHQQHHSQSPGGISMAELPDSRPAILPSYPHSLVRVTSDLDSEIAKAVKLLLAARRTFSRLNQSRSSASPGFPGFALSRSTARTTNVTSVLPLHQWDQSTSLYQLCY